MTRMESNEDFDITGASYMKQDIVGDETRQGTSVRDLNLIFKSTDPTQWITVSKDTAHIPHFRSLVPKVDITKHHQSFPTESHHSLSVHFKWAGMELASKMGPICHSVCSGRTSNHEHLLGPLCKVNVGAGSVKFSILSGA